MRIQLGEHILTRDGQDAGVVDKVILDPDLGRVAAVVLRKGVIPHHDVEVALDQLREDADGNHRLIFDAEQLDELPPFDEASYSIPPPDFVTPYDDLRGGVLWPAGWLGTPMPANPPPYAGDRALREETIARLYEQDLANAVVKAGSTIRSRDGQKVGELARLTFTENEGRLASIVVRQGFLFPKEMELPGSLVDSADDGVLYLNVDKAHVAELAQDGHERGASRS